MKKIIFLLLFGFFLMASCNIYFPTPAGDIPPPVEEYPVERAPEPTGELDVSYFYNYLSPYGVWVYHPVHRYVWVPSNMTRGWRPYTRGQWIWTDYGWTWRSLVTWGWAPFHYGRWGWEGDLGWYWVPGNVWGPCWVTWRHSDFYIGWAPLPPGVRFIQGVGVRHGSFRVPSRYWNFVDGPNFLNPSVYRHVFPYERNVTIINYTVHQTNITIRNNKVHNNGVGHERAQKITKKNIGKHALKDTQKAELRRMAPGTVEVYRPKIKKNENAKPKSSVRKEEAKGRISESKISVTQTTQKKAPAKKGETMEKFHEREVKLLEQSQRKELRELDRQKEEKKRVLKTTTEKTKVEKEFQSKSSQLKKSHETEKVEVKKRHDKEKEAKKKEEEEKKKKEANKKVKKKIKK
jgi:hypothetical protein